VAEGAQVGGSGETAAQVSSTVTALHPRRFSQGFRTANHALLTVTTPKPSSGKLRRAWASAKSTPVRCPRLFSQLAVHEPSSPSPLVNKG
jgi:hypothetical protein